MKTRAIDLFVMTITHGACSQGTDWLRGFKRDAPLSVVLDGLRLSNIHYLRWLLYNAFDPIFPPDELMNLRTALMEYQNETSYSRVRMILDCENILQASPVNLETWERRVLKYEAENSTSWAAFKQTILPDLTKWLERLP